MSIIVEQLAASRNLEQQYLDSIRLRSIKLSDLVKVCKLKKGEFFEAKLDLFKELVLLKKDFLSLVGISTEPQYRNKRAAKMYFLEYCCDKYPTIFYRSNRGDLAAHVQKMFTYVENWDAIVQVAIDHGIVLDSEHAASRAYAILKGNKVPSSSTSRTYDDLSEELHAVKVELAEKDVEISQLKARIAQLEASRFTLNRKVS